MRDRIARGFMSSERLRRRSTPSRQRPSRHLARAGLLFALPAVVVTLLTNVIPIVFGLAVSFTDYNPLQRGAPEPVGLDNYVALIGDEAFLNSLLVTARYVLQVLVPTVGIALVLAMLVNRPFRGVSFVRAGFYLPNIVALTAVSVVWLWMYSPDGFFNDIFAALSLPEQSWLQDESSALNAVSVMRIWKALGSNMILLLAGLQAIDLALYEAARVDGASAWQQFRYVTLPGLRPVLIFVVAMDIIYLAQGFAEIYVLTGGGPLSSTTTVNYLIFTEAFQYNNMGGASAMAFVLFALIAAFASLTVRGMVGRDKR